MTWLYLIIWDVLECLPIQLLWQLHPQVMTYIIGSQPLVLVPKRKIARGANLPYFPVSAWRGGYNIRRPEECWSLFISNGRMNVNTVYDPFLNSMDTELNTGPDHHKTHNVYNIFILKWLLLARQIRRKSTLLSTFLYPSNKLSRDLRGVRNSPSVFLSICNLTDDT